MTIFGSKKEKAWEEKRKLEVFVFKGKREWSKASFEERKKSLCCVRENRRKT